MDYPERHWSANQAVSLSPSWKRSRTQIGLRREREGEREECTYHQYTNIKLLRHSRQPPQKLIQLLLTICQFSSPAIIHAETRHNAIDDQEAVFVGGEDGGEGVKEFELMFGVEGTRVGYVLLGL